MSSLTSYKNSKQTASQDKWQNNYEKDFTMIHNDMLPKGEEPLRVINREGQGLHGNAHRSGCFSGDQPRATRVHEASSHGSRPACPVTAGRFQGHQDDGVLPGHDGACR